MHITTLLHFTSLIKYYAIKRTSMLNVCIEVNLKITNGTIVVNVCPLGDTRESRFESLGTPGNGT